jgi:hypothetical protein
VAARPRQPEITRPQPVVPSQRVIPWWAGPDYNDNEWLRPGGPSNPGGPGGPGGPDGSARTRPAPKAAD